MKRILSRIGIGAARVDTVLPTTTLTPGESVEATVEIEGGSTEQEIDGIYFALLTRYTTDDGHSTGTIDSFELADSFTIEPDEERTIPVEIQVPHTTPLTLGRTKVWLKTGLDVDWALDPGDEDHVEVQPDTRLSALFDALDSLGFVLRTAECKAGPTGLLSGSRSFVQEFEYVPKSGPFAGRVDEIELVLRPSADSVDVLIEVDRRGGLLSELADVDERFERFSFSDEDADTLADHLETVIDRNA